MNTVFLVMFITLMTFGIVGLCMARKIRNADSFYVMEEKAPTLLLVCGICMSYISAVTMSNGPTDCYEFGPFFLLTTAQPGAWLGLLVAVLFIGRKMKALGCYTMLDYFVKRFANSNVTFLALLIMVVGMEIYGISQLVILGTALSKATGLSYQLIILILTIALMFFCVPGGTWGIMMTDTLMFVVVLFAALVVCPVIIYSIYPEAIQALPHDFLSAGGTIHSTPFNSISNMILWFTLFAGSPVLITRVFPAKNEYAVFTATVVSVLLIALISFMVYFTAGVMKGVDPNITARDWVMFEAFLDYAPIGLGCIGIAAIITAGISTSSVLFCLAGFSLSRDLYTLLNPEMEENINSVHRARVAQAFAVGVGGVIASLGPFGSFDMGLFACGIFAASWLPTIIMSLLWKRYNSTAAFYGMFSGAAILVIFQVLFVNQTISLPASTQYMISMIASIIISVIVALRTPIDPNNSRRHYQIYSAHISDLAVREVRITPGALPELLKGYYRARKVMAAVAMLTILVLLLLCVLFYRFIL